MTTTAEVPVCLSREEKLAIWREEKKNKKKQGSTASSSRPSLASNQQKTPKPSSAPRLSVTTSYGSIKQTPHLSTSNLSPSTRSAGQPLRHQTPRRGVETTSRTSFETSRIPFSSLSRTSITNLATTKTTFVSTRSRRKPIFKTSPRVQPSLGKLATSKGGRQSLGKPMRLSAASVQDAHSSDKSDNVLHECLNQEEVDDEERYPANELMVGSHIEIKREDPVSPLSMHSSTVPLLPSAESPYREVLTIGEYISLPPDDIEENFSQFEDEFFNEAVATLDIFLNEVEPEDVANGNVNKEVISDLTTKQDERQKECSKSPRCNSSRFEWEEDSPEIIAQKHSTRKRRADSLYLLLPKPSPLDTPSPINVENLDEISSMEAPGPTFLDAPSVRSAFNRISPTKSSKAFVLADDDESSGASAFLLEETIKLNGVSLLEPISEIVASSDPKVQNNFHHSVICPGCKDNNALQERLKTLMLEKQALENRLSDIRRAYEQRITPFRDVFEMSRKIQMENQVLHADKEATQATVIDLEKKMIEGLCAAVQKTNMLQAKLAETDKRNEELEQRLLSIQTMNK